MVRRRSLHRSAVALVIGLTGALSLPAPAQTRPTQLNQVNERLDEATRQIESLKQEVRRLQGEHQEIHAPGKPAHGLTAGYDGGHFFIASADHDFKLTFEGQVQLRYVYNNRDHPDDGDRDAQGFQFRRVELGVKGYVGNPKLSFKVKGEFERDSGEMVLKDAWIGYAFNDQWSIKGGVFDALFLREYAVSSKAQQAAERSTVTRYFWDDSTKGLLVGYEAGRWRHFGAITAGPDQARTDFTDSSDHYEWALTERSEYLLAGNWKEFEDFANWSSEPFGLLLGAGVSYNKGANFPGATRPNLLKYTADASTKLGNGINLFGAFVGQHVDAASGEPAPGADQFGFVVQAGAFVVPDRLDLFARYEYANLRGAAVDNEENLVSAIDHDKINMITIGANYYLNKHRAKLTFDVVYTLDPLDSHLSSTSTGLLPDMDRGQVAVRTQFQLLF